MKSVLSLMLLLIFLFQGNLYSDIFDEYLIACWSFDDSTATDNSGNGYHGTFMNEVYPVEGHNGKTAIWLQGHGMNSADGGHVLLPMIDFKQYGEFTITMWVKEYQMSYWHGESYIFFEDATDGSLGIMNHFPVPKQDTTLFLKFLVGGNDWTENFTYPLDYNDRGKWIFYCMTYKDGTLKAYKNFELIGSYKQDIKVAGKNAVLGRTWWYHGSTSNTRFIGAMDDVKIYNISLTVDEIRQLRDKCSDDSFKYKDFRKAADLSFIKYCYQDDFNRTVVLTESINHQRGGIGYDKIPNALAVEYDTYRNQLFDEINDKSGNHLAVMSNGNLPISVDHNSSSEIAYQEDIPELVPDGRIFYSQLDYFPKDKILSEKILINK